MTGTTVVEVLRVARRLFAEAPSHVPYPEVPPEGTFCMLLATQQAALELSGESGNIWDGLMLGADNALRVAAGTPLLVDWNARHDTATVLACFDRAIEETT
jgi:hypothetical protein